MWHVVVGNLKMLQMSSDIVGLLMGLFDIQVHPPPVPVMVTQGKTCDYDFMHLDVTLSHSMVGRVLVHVKMVDCYYDDVSLDQVLVDELPSNINDGGAIMLAARHFSETDANNATTLSMVI